MDILIEQGKKEEKLNYSELYHKVDDNLRGTKGKGISTRDFDSEVKLLVKEKRLQRTEDKNSKRKYKPVYFLLTDYTKKEYQHELLGIDEEKERKKKLFHLLFFYEASKAGQISFLGDQQFDDFLKSLSLTRDDLKVSNIETDDISESFIRYQSLKGIEISKYERRGPPSNAAIRERLEELGIADKDIILYNVTIPGFSIEEIFQYHQKNINKNKN